MDSPTRRTYVPRARYSFTCNQDRGQFPLIGFSLENGCTEIRPGSHLIVDPVTTSETEGEALFKDYHVCSEERGTILASVQMVMPVGSVVVQGMRYWHQSMPNYTDQVRSMTAMVYFLFT